MLLQEQMLSLWREILLDRLVSNIALQWKAGFNCGYLAVVFSSSFD